jgi:hypothetical protein
MYTSNVFITPSILSNLSVDKICFEDSIYQIDLETLKEDSKSY